MLGQRELSDLIILLIYVVSKYLVNYFFNWKKAERNVQIVFEWRWPVYIDDK